MNPYAPTAPAEPPGGVYKLAAAVAPAPAAAPPDRLAAAGIEPALLIDDLARACACSRREIERMRAGGKVPRPDFHVGRRSPRWFGRTIKAWLERGCRP
jgi:hypothetical protein